MNAFKIVSSLVLAASSGLFLIPGTPFAPTIPSRARISLTNEHQQQSSQDLSTSKLDELAKLPVGLKVSHMPTQVRAQREGRSGEPFTWLYRTSVAALNKPVTMTEFGVFVWLNNKWQFSNFTHKPFTGADFAEWYSCPNAVVKSGHECSDPNNWSGSRNLTHLQARWYYIGVTTDGNRVKGEAIVELLPELK